jgi:hypothetical protein
VGLRGVKETEHTYLNAVEYGKVAGVILLDFAQEKLSR